MMKRITGIATTLFIIITASARVQAQSHHKAAPNCVYAKDYYASLPKKSQSPYVSCIDCYCKACGEKQAKEQEKKQQQEKQAIEKRARETEKRRQDQIKNIQEQKKYFALQQQKARENEVVLVAPKSQSGNSTVNANTTKTPPKADLSKKRAWQARFSPRDKEAGFGYYDTESKTWVWTLQTPDYKYDRYYGFAENSDYSTIGIGGDGNNRQTSSCGTTYYPTITGIIDRTGKLVKQGAAGTQFILIGSTPFAIEIEKFSIGGEGCAARFFNVRTGEKVAELSRNMSYKYNNTTRVNYTGRQGIYYFNKGQLHKYYSGYEWIETSPTFSTKLNQVFDSGNYELCVLYADKAFAHQEGATAYFFGNDGSYKIVDDDWVTEFINKKQK